MAYGIGALVLAALLCLAYVLWRLRRRGLDAPTRTYLARAWVQATTAPDPVRRVLDAEKILDSALRELKYDGTFADKLRAAGPRIPNHDAVWDAHRLRNRLAHDVGARCTTAEADHALRAFARALSVLGVLR